jgi:hypothetical protein
VTGLDYVTQIDWYTELGVNGPTCSEFRESQRGRYIRLAQYLEGNESNASTRLRVMNTRGFATPMPDGALVNDRTYDMAVQCTGLKMDAVEDSLQYYLLAQGEAQSNGKTIGTILGRQASPYQSFRVGPRAELPFTRAEEDAGLAALAATKSAIFRLAPRTAALATRLSLAA